MKRVLILNPCLYTLGGGEKDMAYFCWVLENNYSDVIIDILVYNYNGVEVFSEGYPTIESLEKRFDILLHRTSILKMNVPRFSYCWVNDYIDLKIYLISRKYDLFVNWNYLSKQLGGALFNLYLCMFPPERSPSYSRNILKRFVRKKRESAFINDYDKFLVISEYTRNWFSAYWPEVLKNRIVLLYPPVLFENEAVTYDCIRKKQNVILSVGRFFVAGHNKKQLEMINAFLEHEEFFSDYEYHLVGALTSNMEDIDYYHEIERISRKSNRIQLHVNCRLEELKNLYLNAKFFWHATGLNENEQDNPGSFEHFGITTVEAMNYGVVPIVIQKGGQTEIVDDGINGYLWQNLDQCIFYTKQLCCDEKNRCKMAIEAVEKAQCYAVEAFERECKRIVNDYLC